MNVYPSAPIALGIAGGAVDVFSDEACTEPVAIFDLGGGPLSMLPVGFDGVLPQFQCASTAPVYVRAADGAVVALYAAASESTPAGGSVSDTGYVEIQAITSGGGTVATCYAAPEYAPDQGQFFSQCPPQGSDWAPLQVLDSGDTVYASEDNTFADDLYDTVDFSGVLVVWDLTGANLLAASFGGSVPGSDGGAVDLTQTQLIGSDLSIVDGDLIQSAGGGVYNVQVRLVAGWD